MTPDLREALVQKLLALADDELILGHRNSEWTGHGPILEEDIAFTNIALDELGHAKIWYGLVAELQGENPDTYPDRLVFFRDAPDYRNSQLVELPKGDWAFSMLRQYLFDGAELVWLSELATSRYQPLAEAAVKVRGEEIYHLRHTSAWLKRLGLGTEESNRRMQAALNELWPYTAQLFEPLPGEAILVEAGFGPAPAVVREKWESLVRSALTEADLNVPSQAAPVTVSRNQHTPHLASLLKEMQEVARALPEAEW